MMNEQKICQAYSTAGDLRQRITALAKANGTTTDVIRGILIRNGYSPPAMPAPARCTPVLVPPKAALTNRGLERALRLMELAEQGTSAEKIAEEFGVCYGQALPGSPGSVFSVRIT
ncbi:MAG: hypothetical protein HFF11_02805 [Angelakisella sp.]|jgi:hypothetical protein|nr:hypothetical protein [Angelakisella sp.]